MAKENWMEIKTMKDLERNQMNENIKKLIAGILILIAGAILGVSTTITLTPDPEPEVQIEEVEKEVPVPVLELSDEQKPALIETDQGEVKEEIYPTVEEVDGGQFKDKFTGLSVIERKGEYKDLGWSETYDVSSPEAFKNATLGHCVIANNIYGAQCVSLARVFWWSYADRDVSTCGTGAAKGMMICYEDNARDDFEVYWKEEAYKIQAGDWLVFDGGLYGHVGMALGGDNNGYVALLGENQGGASCGEDVGGSATNIINISLKNLIGFYRPKAYNKDTASPSIPEELPETSH